MAKKKTVKKKAKLHRHKITEEEFMETLVRLTERAITKQGSEVDLYLKQQSNNIKKQLKELRKRNEVS